MENENTDNKLENYFFGLVLKKEVTKHALEEIYEILIKANDEIEDDLTKATSDENAWLFIDFSNLEGNFSRKIHFSHGISQYLFWKYEPLKWLEANNQIYIWKLFFWSDFSGIENMNDYIQMNILNDIEKFRTLSLEKQWLVFNIIFSIIENLLNLNDDEFTNFLMNQQKENVEIDLLYVIEKALKLFEENSRENLLSFRSIMEKIHSENFLSDEELEDFKTKTVLLSKELIKEYTTHPIITDGIKKFEKMRVIFKNSR